MTQVSALSVTGLSVRYDGRRVLDEVSFELPQGRLAAVVGPNGAGKTTLLNALLGLIDREAGVVQFFSGTLADKRPSVAYVPQRSQVDQDFPINVYDVVMMGRLPTLRWWQRPSQYDHRIVEKAIAQVGLEEVAKKVIGSLSGGQQQRMFVARALAQQASLYVMDEPFAAIDAASEATIVGQLRTLQQQGATALCVHHDLNTVSQYFDYLFLLNRSILAAGEMARTFVRENLSAIYGSNTNLVDEVHAQMTRG